MNGNGRRKRLPLSVPLLFCCLIYLNKHLIVAVSPQVPSLFSSLSNTPLGATRKSSASSNERNRNDNGFEPYELNGGLVSAIAGKGYCIVACDTRLMKQQFNIATRHYTKRLWSLPTTTIHPLQEQQDDNNDENDLDLDIDNWIRSIISSQVTSGNDKNNNGIITCNRIDMPVDTTTWIASGGCSADCEAVQRHLLYEYRQYHYPFQQQQQQSLLSATHVARLLSTVLYQRRTFPFYAFHVVAGLERQDDEYMGKAFSYDAIGSYEQVAVATGGTGCELLQPILDRLFTSSSDAGTMTTTTTTKIVKESLSQAIQKVVQAYHAVTEREIGVGDSLLLQIMTTTTGNAGEINQEDELVLSRQQVVCRQICIPLKQH